MYTLALTANMWLKISMFHI